MYHHVLPIDIDYLYHIELIEKNFIKCIALLIKL
nr:MAG TPA: hypothetical protein [Caudoviricetes sp.]